MNKAQQRVIDALQQSIPLWATHGGQDQDGTIVIFDHYPRRHHSLECGGFFVREGDHAAEVVSLGDDVSTYDDWDQSLVTITHKCTHHFGDVQ